MKEHGKKFFNAAIELLKRNSVPGFGDMKAFCNIHKKQCNVFEDRLQSEHDPTLIRMLIAGVNCYDWSSRGTQEGWLGDSCLSYLELVREVLLFLYDLVIFECVRDFDEDGLQPLTSHYDVKSLVFSPILLGLPCSRTRKYMLMVRRESFMWLPEITGIGHQEAFEALFARSMHVYGHELFRGPSEMMAEMRDRMAAARGLPAKKPTGKDWSFFQVLPPGIRANIQLQEEAMRDNKEGLSAKHGVLITATQRGKFSSTMPVCPAILRQTVIWSTGLQRPGHHLEFFEVMGYRMFADTTSSETAGSNIDPASNEDDSLAQAIKKLDWKDAGSLVGNGVNVAAMACAQLFLMACSQRMPAVPPA